MSTESIRMAADAAAPPSQVATPGVIPAPTVADFAVYLRELPRLLKEGHAGRWALIMGDEVISVWDTARDVLQAGHERFDLEPFIVKKIDPREPARIAAIVAKERAACPS
jgi:hypothetical protein